MLARFRIRRAYAPTSMIMTYDTCHMLSCARHETWAFPTLRVVHGCCGTAVPTIGFATIGGNVTAPACASARKDSIGLEPSLIGLNLRWPGQEAFDTANLAQGTVRPWATMPKRPPLTRSVQQMAWSLWAMLLACCSTGTAALGAATTAATLSAVGTTWHIEPNLSPAALALTYLRFANYQELKEADAYTPSKTRGSQILQLPVRFSKSRSQGQTFRGKKKRKHTFPSTTYTLTSLW